MSLKITSDFSAMANSSLTQLHKHQSVMGKSIERVSTGFRINSAEDNSVKYYLAKKHEMKAEEQDAVSDVLQGGASRLRMTDKALDSILNTLKKMREEAMALTTKTADGSAAALAADNYAMLGSAAKNIVTNTKFNGVSVLNATKNVSTILMVDPLSGWELNFKASSKYLASAKKVWSKSLTSANASSIATVLTSAIQNVAQLQGSIGAALAQTSIYTDYLSDMSEMNTEAKDTIKNADMAKEMTTYVKSNVLAQASQAMLSQANSGLASVLNLLS